MALSKIQMQFASGFGRFSRISAISGFRRFPDFERPDFGISVFYVYVFCSSKRFCACDGVTIWDERDRILAQAEGKHSAL